MRDFMRETALAAARRERTVSPAFTRSSSACLDCGWDTCDIMCSAGTEYYMVHTTLWRSAGMKPRGGMLCIVCLERRLARSLTSRDFTNAIINAPEEPLGPAYYRTAALTQRMNDGNGSSRT